MRVKYLFTLILLTAGCFVSVFGQNIDNKSKETKLNFSGTWILDNKKSATFMLEQRRTNIPDCDETKIITQTEFKITIKSLELCKEKTKIGIQEKRSQWEEAYFLDKRGETNVNLLNKTIYSETELKKNNLLIKEYETDSMKLKSKQIFASEFRLSKDGKTLYLRIDMLNLDLPFSKTLKSYSELVFKLKE